MRYPILAGFGLGAAGLVLAGATAWGALALYYLAPGRRTARIALAWGFAALGVVEVGALLLGRGRWPAAIGFAVAFGLVLAVWARAIPSNDRAWREEVAALPWATIDGDLVTVHNIRNFDYRTETDFTPGYYDRTFDLRRLDRVDLVAVYWMGPAVAHLFLSFGFGDQHLPISIEVRKRRGEDFSALAGIFRQYEIYYAVGDERDIIRVRTNYRQPPEDVYLFRVPGTAESGRRVFLDYMREINELRRQPRFYNTLTTNCTTLILTHAAVNPGRHVPLSWKVLLSGYAPEYFYDLGRLDRSLPFAELKRRGHVNAVARAADQAADFSQRIRAGLP